MAAATLGRVVLKLTGAAVAGAGLAAGWHWHCMGGFYPLIAETAVGEGSVFEFPRHPVPVPGPAGIPADGGDRRIIPLPQPLIEDCFEVLVPRTVFPAHQSRHFQLETALVDFVRAWYETPLFRLERQILSLTARGEFPPDVSDRTFRINEQYGFWRVVARRTQGLSMHFTMGSQFHGTTNFSVLHGPAEYVTLRFGSACGGTDMPAAAIQLHRWYSKALLAQTAQHLTQAAERRRHAAEGADRL